ncbi:MAG TPA: N-acetylmuramoyl-L-alanine amidase [Chloroflexota bacterium]|nr:N-acetylmuramoyl-L-alanine amidase [Chloroflexota bacterium]
MSYIDTTVVPVLRKAAIPVVDLRTVLPRNTRYKTLRQWSQRPVQAITHAVYHHPAYPLRPEGPHDSITRWKAIAQVHIDKDWGGGYHAPTLTYHLVIDAHGQVLVCNHLEDVTWHASNANGFSVGVCIDVGEGQAILPAQVLALQWVADALNTATPEMPVSRAYNFGHGEPELRQYGNATACPGAVLPCIQSYRRTGHMIEPQPQVPEARVLNDWQVEMLSLMEEPLYLNAGAVRNLINAVPALEEEVSQLRAQLAQVPDVAAIEAERNRLKTQIEVALAALRN